MSLSDSVIESFTLLSSAGVALVYLMIGVKMLDIYESAVPLFLGGSFLFTLALSCSIVALIILVYHAVYDKLSEIIGESKRDSRRKKS